MTEEKKKRRSLQKFVHDKKEEKKATDCILCTIPEKDEIAKARAAGAQLKHIAEWLVAECGYDKVRIHKSMKRMSHHLGNHLGKEGKDDWTAKL